LSETTQAILAEVDAVQPNRIVFDSMSELRLLAGNPLRYRRQVLALKQFFAGRRCTVLLLDDRTQTDHDLQVQSIAHGVIALDQTYPEYGVERRRVRVIKYRGVSFRGGYHDFVIRRGGLEVFERIVAGDSRQAPARRWLSSGVPELDLLLGGGVEGGSSTLWWARPVPENPRSPGNLPRRPRSAARLPRCSCSTKVRTSCSTAWMGSASICGSRSSRGA
jgi:circadian clock protein KaiC